VFGWKNVHKHEGSLVGKKQDKAGRWRLAKVPYYSTNPVHALSVDDRMKQLGRLDRYQEELFKLTRAKNIPAEWATPDQRCRAAVKALGQYGQVIPLSRSRNQIQKSKLHLYRTLDLYKVLPQLHTMSPRPVLDGLRRPNRY
jgi:hypothetical protein